MYNKEKQEGDVEEVWSSVDRATLDGLNESTKTLLSLLDKIKMKIHTTHCAQECTSTPPVNNLEHPVDQERMIHDLNYKDLQKLKKATNNFEVVHITEEKDDCSVYKKLIRKCQCLNQSNYNDFVIQFNEDGKCISNNAGEIIKNIRILKKFLRMGGVYTRNVLLFLNEGLSQSTRTEKIEIIQGCSNADVCNIFDEYSIVVLSIIWPCKVSHYGDSVTQSLTAKLIFNLAKLEEGRRYLNLNSKITHDIQKTLRKYYWCLETDTVETLKTSLDLLKPVFTKTFNVPYIAKPINEGMGTRTIKALVKSSKIMTLDEVLLHLDIIHSLSRQIRYRKELILQFPILLILFKQLMKEYDNSELNILTMKILYQLISKQVMTDQNDEENFARIAETTTEPIIKKNVCSQIPPKKNLKKNITNKTRTTFRLSKKSKLKDGKTIIVVPVVKHKKFVD